jgi:hypothetical protein
MLPLLILSLLSAPQYRGSNRIPRDGRCSSRTGTCSTTNPGFQFLFSGGTECAGTVPTGSKGETISFSRAGGQTCTRANGNVVKLTANQPVVESLTGMAMSDGNLATTGAQLGMLDEASVANNVLVGGARQRCMDARQGLGSANADRDRKRGRGAQTAPSPPNGCSSIATTGISQFSAIFQANACPVGLDTGSFYVKSHDGVSTGTVDLAMTGAVVPVTYSGVWTRLIDPSVTISSASVLEIGNLSVVNGSIARNAADLDVWGAQCELSPWATSYIPTTTVAVTRSATSWTVDTTTLSPPLPAQAVASAQTPTFRSGRTSVVSAAQLTGVDCLVDRAAAACLTRRASELPTTSFETSMERTRTPILR